MTKNRYITRKGAEALKNKVMDYLTQSNYSGVDPECVNLCKAINKIPGLFTLLSCCGHGEFNYQIVFRVIDPNNLPILLSCIHENYKWSIAVHADYYKSPPVFTLSGPVGDPNAGDELANELNELLVRITNGEE